MGEVGLTERLGFWSWCEGEEGNGEGVEPDSFLIYDVFSRFYYCSKRENLFILYPQTEFHHFISNCGYDIISANNLYPKSWLRVLKFDFDNH